MVIGNIYRSINIYRT